MNKSQKKRFAELQDQVPSLEDVTFAIMTLDESTDLPTFITAVEAAIGVVSTLDGVLQDLRDGANELQEDLE